MSRDILLTGSVGLDSAEEVFRTLGRALGTRAPRLPDGETGYARSVWIQSQAPFFLGNPAFEQVEPDPDRPGELRCPRPAGGPATSPHHRSPPPGWARHGAPGLLPPSPALTGWALEGRVEGHHVCPTPVPTSPSERRTAACWGHLTGATPAGARCCSRLTIPVDAREDLL
jgi:hypothetical protein